jgi:hypothetical protein
MPRYYYHVHDGRRILDDEGTDMPGLGAARGLAIARSGEILTDGAAGSLWSGEPWRMWVTDGPNGDGKTLFTLRFEATEGDGVLPSRTR